jgi:hypothetical protein
MRDVQPFAPTGMPDRRVCDRIGILGIRPREHIATHTATR